MAARTPAKKTVRRRSVVTRPGRMHRRKPRFAALRHRTRVIEKAFRRRTKVIAKAPESRIFGMLFVIATIAVLITVAGLLGNAREAIKYSSFAMGAGKYALAFSLAWLADKFLCPTINTRSLLSKDPRAYATFLAANILAAALCFASS